VNRNLNGISDLRPRPGVEPKNQTGAAARGKICDLTLFFEGLPWLQRDGRKALGQHGTGHPRNAANVTWRLW